MFINKPKCRVAATDILLVLVSVVYALGIRIWFPVCAAKEDAVMSCHYAGEVLKALSVLLAILSAAHLVSPDGRVKLGIDIALGGLAVLAMNVPGGIIPICAMGGMACRAKALPGTLICGAVFVILALFDAFLFLAENAKEKHARRDGKD